jgi:DnaJ-related protein SCJ1
VEKQVACPHCKGTGAENPYDIVTCHECNGQGRVTRRVELGGGYYNMYTQVCPRCQGKGKVIGRKCHLCHSQKIIPGVEEFTLKVKPGSASHSDLRYTNMGDERMQGAPSDIIFQLVEIEHPYFKREGDHLRTEITISLEEVLNFPFRPFWDSRE